MRKWITGALLLLTATTFPFTTKVADAQKPDLQGWWWLYKQPTLPVDPKPLVPAFPDIPELPSPPNVPGDGLYVASTPAGVQAISALSFVIPEGAKATKLTLTPATPLTPTAEIRLCQNNSTWQAVQGGRWTAKPLYACAADAPLGVIPIDGSTITFTLGKLGESQLIDVSLVPTDTATVQATFVKPTDKVLEVILGAAADVSGAVGTGSAVLGTTGGPTSIENALGTPALAQDLVPYLNPGPDETLGAAPRTNLPTELAQTAPVVQVVEKRDNLENLGMFGLIILAAIFSRVRQTPAREPRSLVNFGKHEDAE